MFIFTIENKSLGEEEEEEEEEELTN